MNKKIVFSDTNTTVRPQFSQTSGSFSMKFSQGTGGGTDHNDLVGRDAENQHPMSAITGLTDELKDIVSKEEAFFDTYEEAEQAAKNAEEIGDPNTIFYYTQIVHVTKGEQAGLYEITRDNALRQLGGKGDVGFTTDETLTLNEYNVLSVNTAQEPEPDNTLPITSAAVATTVGNIDVILKTI